MSTLAAGLRRQAARGPRAGGLRRLLASALQALTGVSPCSAGKTLTRLDKGSSLSRSHGKTARQCPPGNGQGEFTRVFH